MKNFSKPIGVIIANIAILVCTIAACGNEDIGKTVTFSLDKIENYSFTITVEGAKWADFTYDTYKVGNLVRFFPNYTISVVDEQNPERWRAFEQAFPVENWKRTSDTVVTATYDMTYIPRRMGIEFDAPGTLYFSDWASNLIAGGKFEDTYNVNSAKSSIKWE
jgi:hypothetical protein